MIRKFTLLSVILLLLANVGFAQEKTVAGLYNEGLALLKSKDYQGGLDLMEEALAKAGPDDEKVVNLAKKNGAIAAYNLGNAQRKEGSYEAAIELYNKGIELNPSNSSNVEGIARALEGKGDKVMAIKTYIDAAQKGEAEGKAKKVESRTKKAQTMIGNLFVAKSYEDAIVGGGAFLEMDPTNSEVHYYVSRSYAETGNTEKAVEHADSAIENSSEPKDKYFYALATQLEALGKKTEAIASYKKITGEEYKKQATYKISELGG